MWPGSYAEEACGRGRRPRGAYFELGANAVYDSFLPSVVGDTFPHGMGLGAMHVAEVHGWVMEYLLLLAVERPRLQNT